VIDALHDPGTGTALARAERVPLRNIEPMRLRSGAALRVGVASWTDPSMTARGVFYPASATSAESRLRYYASRFPLVEVDSTYYALPMRRTAELWVERTPDDFTFNVKAHALMTGQPSEVSRLPKELREALPGALARRARIYSADLPTELQDAVWASFLDAITPLRAAGKLGSILMQYPKWVGPSRENARLIASAAERLHDWTVAVELRNRDWFDDATRPKTLDFLRQRGLSYVIVDSPPGFESSVPAVPVVTNPALAVIRFHGRNVDTWEAKVSQVSDRFRYLYDETQLAEWLPAITAVSEQAETVHLVFNNCYGNYGTTNALEIAGLLMEKAGVEWRE
jgi:uncharacterized protein YecE (DUF72 family)